MVVACDFSVWSQEGTMRPTKWYVITGAPCSGKTTVVQGLERLGYRVVHEVARSYIAHQMNRGQSLERVKADQPAFQRHILHARIGIEKTLPENRMVFLDRAVPDSIAYFKLAGLNPEPAIAQSGTMRYRKIFLFDRLPYKADTVRRESEEEAERLHDLIEDSYRRLFYDIERVPVLSVEDRIRFILRHL
jgi:predicted ATPase